MPAFDQRSHNSLVPSKEMGMIRPPDSPWESKVLVRVESEHEQQTGSTEWASYCILSSCLLILATSRETLIGRNTSWTGDVGESSIQICRYPPRYRKIIQSPVKQKESENNKAQHLQKTKIAKLVHHSWQQMRNSGTCQTLSFSFQNHRRYGLSLQQDATLWWKRANQIYSKQSTTHWRSVRWIRLRFFQSADEINHEEDHRRIDA